MSIVKVKVFYSFLEEDKIMEKKMCIRVFEKNVLQDPENYYRMRSTTGFLLKQVLSLDCFITHSGRAFVVSLHYTSALFLRTEEMYLFLFLFWGNIAKRSIRWGWRYSIWKQKQFFVFIFVAMWQQSFDHRWRFRKYDIFKK